MTPEKKLIFDKSLYLARRGASQYVKRDNRFTYEEIYSAALEGLWKAVEKHNPDKSKIGTYASIRIKGTIIDYVRTIYGRMSEYPREPYSLDASIIDGEDRTVTHQKLAVTDKVVEDDAFWEEIIAGLSERDGFFICEYYRYGKTMKEISESLGVSESAISILRKQILPRIKSLHVARMDQMSV